MKKFIFISSMLLVVQSCSSNVKGGWDCPIPEGGKGSCVSIKTADFSDDSNPDSSDKPRFTYLDSKQKIEINLVAPKLKELKKIGENLQVKDENISVKSPQLRTQERVGKIWFAPHIDSEGNQHSERVIFVVDEQPQWLMQK